jgi:O-antigen/teichoic acid export membrane protein
VVTGMWVSIRSSCAQLKQHWSLRNNKLNQNTAWMLLGNGARLLFQAVYFVMIARNLGPRQYGAFVAVTATAALVAPFIGNGFSSVMIKRVAHDRTQLQESFGNVLAVTLVSGLLLAALFVPACLVLLPRTIPPIILVMLLASDVLVTPYVGVAGAAFWSLEKMGWTAALNAFLTLTRMSGIIVIVLLHRPTLMAWSITYLLTSVLSSIVAVGIALWFLGMPRLGLQRIKGQLREGFYFSASMAAQTVYNDIDKTMLARLATLDAVGIYGAAYRLVDLAFVPVSALLSASYPGFFRQGKEGIHGSMQYGRRLFKQIVPYSLFAVAALFVAAPLVPWVLGHHYGQVTEALRWLAVLPLLKTMHFFIADTLTGAGYQGLRTIVQIGVAVFNVLINLWIIPAHGWRGAAWSSIASDGLLALGLWFTVRHLSARASLAGKQVETITVGRI